MAVVRFLQLVCLGIALFLPAGVSAESPADRTGTGGGPQSTITAPNTTTTGVTKPPGVEEGPETPRERSEMDRVKRDNDKIENSICAGCK